MFIQSKRRFYACLMTAGLVLGCAMSDDDDGVAEAVCEVDADDTDCDVCIKTGCCGEYSSCQNDTDCLCVLNCANDNQPREVCATRCNVTDENITDILTLLGGENQTCTVQCDDECAVYGFVPVDGL
ncbi:hypothetical protein [Nannocystis punicea]|uniref:Uncharacterized protein n=1 Tax=Nannocystis punicea TaxID=2995304 RepID=A0ABY7H503_9BACT|nr:hypothetical protein [Nannocystis poenicansa]WAS94267.1 hypothetical protein O0S08_49730 [Nannocystis poenicansa]